MSEQAKPELTNAVLEMRNAVYDVLSKYHLNIRESVTVWCVCAGMFFNCCRAEMDSTVVDHAFESFISKLYELYLRKEEHHAD